MTVYDGRPAADLADPIAALGGRPVALALGPDVDSRGTWAEAALVATSPSITPDFATTEPRLRAALQQLVAARTDGDRTAPSLVSEADLFLRLTPAPTIGVTGTKGKTTTSSLIAAILAADAGHPVVLGGNIGILIVERLLELTPEHRVVDELSELQLPTLSRGTTVAVYTNVTADHLDRHGSVDGYRRVKRRLAELVDPAGALVINAEDPVVAGYAGLGGVRTVSYRWLTSAAVWRAGHGRWRRHRGWRRAAGRSRSQVRRRVVALVCRRWPNPAHRGARDPGRPQRLQRAAAVAVGLLFGLPSEAIRGAAGAFEGVEHRLEAVATAFPRRAVHQRFAGGRSRTPSWRPSGRSTRRSC